MVYADLAGYAAMAASGYVLGTQYGRKLVSDMASGVRALEARLGVVEQTVAGHRTAATSGSDKHAVAVEHHALAVEKLAAAVDDHGAAMVAAAVENNATIAAHASMGMTFAAVPGKN